MSTTTADIEQDGYIKKVPKVTTLVTNQSIFIYQSLFICTHIHSCFKQKVTKFNEIINSKIGVLAAWNNHEG